MAQDSRADGDPCAMLCRAISQSPLSIGLYDTDMRHLQINTALYQELGLKSEAAGLGRRLTELYPESGFEAFEAFARQAMVIGEPMVWQGLGKAAPSTQTRAW